MTYWTQKSVLRQVEVVVAKNFSLSLIQNDKPWRNNSALNARPWQNLRKQPIIFFNFL